METLQLRHQLKATGRSLRAATYDTTRHHVLTFDSHPFRPHILRLFSLRRELKNAPLFDNKDPAQGFSKRPSFLKLQQRKPKSSVEVVVPAMLLQYSPTLDVFICVFSAVTRSKGSIEVTSTMSFSVVLLEPTTLRKLLVYQGPETHSLQCVHFDPFTDKLVLACHVTNCAENGKQGYLNDRRVLPSTPMNMVEILHLSKQSDKHQASSTNDQDQQQNTTNLFLIENTRASLRHPDTVNLICASKGLRELYGAANECVDTTDTLCALLQWRHDRGKLVLVRRVLHRHKISAFAISSCGDWLLIGLCKGGLKVWDVNSSRADKLELLTIGVDSKDTEGSAGTEVISCIEVYTAPMPPPSNRAMSTSRSTDGMIITAERDTGVVRHWKFSVESKTLEGQESVSGGLRYPRVSLVGYFQSGRKEEAGKSNNSLGPPLETLTICVSIDVGSCVENLLLVVREDVIYVLKIHAVHEIHELTPIEGTYAMQALVQQEACHVLSISRTKACNVLVYALDEASHHEIKQTSITPPTSNFSAHVSFIDIVVNDTKQRYVVVLAWSSGIVDVRDVLHDKQIMILQDKQLTGQISALSSVTYPSVIKHAASSYSNEACNASDEAAILKTVIIVGTDSGDLFGWKIKALWDDGLAFHILSKASLWVQAAHSSHVIQLARINSTHSDECAWLSSVDAHGVIKLWSIPSLKQIGSVTSSVAGNPGAPSCIELIRGTKRVKGTDSHDINDLHVILGFQNGQLEGWRLDANQISFRRLDFLVAKHEQLVSRIRCISSNVIPIGSVQFLSSSLDMTVIQWQILDTDSVEKKRYFDIGAAIIDMVLVEEQAIIALPHEVCEFVFIQSKNNNQIEPKVKVRTVLNMLPSKHQTSEDKDLETRFSRSVENFKKTKLHVAGECLTPLVPDAAVQPEVTFNDDSAMSSILPCSPSRTGSKKDSKTYCTNTSDDILREYLQDYITRHGTFGTMAANRITHFLAIRPELPSIKRVEFVVARSLKHLKLTAQSRVNSEEALELLKVMYVMPKGFSQSFKGQDQDQERRSELAYIQRSRERKQAKRKPVVTYNLLGEKFVQWIEQHEDQKSNQANNSNVHACSTPTLQGTSSSRNELPSSDIDDPKAPSHVANLNRENAIIPNNALRHYTSEARKSALIASTAFQSDIKKLDATDAAATRKFTQPTTATTLLTKNNCATDDNMAKDALKHSIRLSPKFQHFWGNGYCWCKPAPYLHVLWSNSENVEESAEDALNRKPRKPKCNVCHKRLHTIKMPHHSENAPHFSRQATFNVIVDVYSKLAASIDHQLSQRNSLDRKSSEKCSIFSALFEVFQATYGMRSAVERKLKLFFVSMSYFIPEYDAAAVFGELLGLHSSRDDTNLDQAPGTLVALCVRCYAWFYSRAVVVDGDLHPGNLRGRSCGWEQGHPLTIKGRTSGTSHWQFVRIEHALLCAQDILLYPLVSPQFLRNIMLLVREYTQQAPTCALRLDLLTHAVEEVEEDENGVAGWIELHRFLRLLVGEWKFEHAKFREVERLLFDHPRRDAAISGDLFEKLRLMLRCFIFYDHDRVGAITAGDFEALLYKLCCLWSEQGESMTPPLSDEEFETVLTATKNRFLDIDHDGQFCYLDFWVMLYNVGVNFGTLIHLKELPSFCRDYKLEISPELSVIVWNYMQLSCILLLPQGFRATQISMDQEVERQHHHRLGSLHNGTFYFNRTLEGSFSTQELLGKDERAKTFGLFVEGDVPATRHTASATRFDRFRPVSVEAETDSSRSSSHWRGQEPKTVGVRHTGPTPKPKTPLRVSDIKYQDESNGKIKVAVVQQVLSKSGDDLVSYATNSNMNIPLPQESLECKEVQNVETSCSARQTENDDNGVVYGLTRNDDSVNRQEEQTFATTSPSFRSTVSMPEIAPYKSVVQAQHKTYVRKPSVKKIRRSTVPSVHTEASVTVTSSSHDIMIQPSSPGPEHAISEPIILEKAGLPREIEAPPSLACRLPPLTPTESMQEKLLMESDSYDNQSILSARLDEGLFENFIDADNGATSESTADVMVPNLPFQTPEPAHDVEVPAHNALESNSMVEDDRVHSDAANAIETRNLVFKFSRHPSFLQNIIALNSPFRNAMWNPNNNTDSDDGDYFEMPTSNLENDVVNRSNEIDAEIKTIKASRPVVSELLDTERALYYEQLLNALCENIALSSMHKNWQQLFDECDSRFTSTIKRDIEDKLAEQWKANEQQRMKHAKWQEQRDQDLKRLQNVRQVRSTLMPTEQTNFTDGEARSGLELRKINRKNCLSQATEELHFGISVERELNEAEEALYFHFYYLPDSNHTSIMLEMHALRGDAEVFVSADTKLPCATDFMWRSSECLLEGGGKGHQVTLYLHELAKAVAASRAATIRQQDVAAAKPKTSSPLRLPFHSKQSAASQQVEFYVSVVALESLTRFKLVLLSSGQKLEPSRAMQTVADLIARFNMISTSFENEQRAPYECTRNDGHGSQSISTCKGSDDGKDDLRESELTKKTKVDGANLEELKSSPCGLDSLKEKQHFESLPGANEEFHALDQDEAQSRELIGSNSYPKDPENCHNSIAIVTDRRRLRLHGKRQNHQYIVAANEHQKLAPLYHQAKPGGNLGKITSTGTLANLRLAKTAPSPVAYSLTKLDPIPHSKRAKPATSPLPRANLMSSHES